MKLNIARTILTEALAAVASVISTRTTLPILSTVRLQATPTGGGAVPPACGRLILTATDLDALATAGDEFLDDIPPPGEGGETTNGSASRAGLTTEHVTFSTPLARDQNDLVHRAIKVAKGLNTSDEKMTTGDALTLICRAYVDSKDPS